jgi:hypothetical protein
MPVERVTRFDDRRLAEYRNMRDPELLVADADKVGSAFRNAAAFGAGGVLLSPASCDPLYRKAIRTSMSSGLAESRHGRWHRALLPDRVIP